MSQAHVVMAVAGPIDHDARVLKTAASVLAAGYRVTVVWTAGAVSQVVEGDLSGVRTIGVPVEHDPAAAPAARLAEETRRPVRGPCLGYRDGDQRRARAAALAAAGGGGLAARLAHRV
ncbi:MAG: hypothetical protein LBR19_03630, partial [Bifidobacteriaceae bacterium]|nr:hypothetical protein [Bifidobacteriaceae bacterium]